MLNLDPVTLILAKRKGASTRNAVLFSTAISFAGTTSLGTIGQVILADKITDRIAVKQDVPVQLPSVRITPVPLPSPLPGLLPKPAPTPSSPQHSIQKVEGAALVDFTSDPPQIEGAAELRIDFVSPVDAQRYHWDFGDQAITTSTAKNPTTKVYSNAGDFNVTLTIIDAAGTKTEMEVAKVKIE